MRVQKRVREGGGRRLVAESRKIQWRWGRGGHAPGKEGVATGAGATGAGAKGAGAKGGRCVGVGKGMGMGGGGEVQVQVQVQLPGVAPQL